VQALEADRACAPDRATNVLALTTRAAWQPWRGVASGVAWLLA
jgi:3-methyladenine DNA glycosylase/8-oxoguanine DNA glycosylase